MNGFPVANLNGASKQSLVDARLAAVEALQDAMRALGECSPNGRDYQTAPAGEYEIARARYIEQFAALDRIANQLQDEAFAIQG